MAISYLIDTNTLSFLAEGNRSALANLAAISADDQIFTCFIVLGEWEYGILNAKSRQLAQQIRASGELILHDFDGNWESSPDVTMDYGAISSHLRAVGTMIPTNDIWIAAEARVHDATLITSDPHFKRVPNLRTVDWSLMPSSI